MTFVALVIVIWFNGIAIAPTEPLKVMFPVPAFKTIDCAPAEVPSSESPKKIAPLLALVLIVIVPDKSKIAGTLLVIVKELAVISPPIETLLVPTAEEMSTAPTGVMLPIAPPSVTAPLEPELIVSGSAPSMVAVELVKATLAPAISAPPPVVSKSIEVVRSELPVTEIAPPAVTSVPPQAIPYELPPPVPETLTVPEVPGCQVGVLT